ncbi:MAG: aromatic amino acid lyase, partial [Anaerobacillus sp.]
NQEDHVSMGTIGARHAYQIILNAQRVVAIELICAMQALEYRGISLASSAVQRLYSSGREVVPTIKEDRVFSRDIEALSTWLRSDQFTWTIHQPLIPS